MIALLLALALSGGPLRAGGRSELRANSNRRPAAASSSGCSASIECGIQAGDKVGNWWVLKSNGTTLSGSALTMAAQGSPGVSPLTFNGTSQYFQSSASVAFPTTSQHWSVVAVFTLTGSTSSQFIVGKWPSGSNSFALGIDGTNPIFYAFSGTTFISATHPAVVSSGTRLAIGWTFDGVNVKVRYSGSNATTAMASLRAPTSPIFVGALDGPTSFISATSLGVFYTETNLSDARVDAIGAAP